ncbi:MAG TPA: hypothetical protein VLC46_00710 [Thermoanaerobaculia bacterium]|jgi:uncharacterized protein YjhX (UPF0386 family)|nr:hypothetical protein [Thermoanaerobaculia bacterium]
MSTHTEDEKSILTNALPTGEIHLMRTDQTGDFVRAGAVNHIDPDDPARQAGGIDAFESLKRKGLVRHEGGQLYKLTGTGFQQAKESAA